MKARPRRSDLLLVAGIALAVRLLYLLEYRHSPYFDFLHLDPLYYHDWALQIASGDWLGKEVFEQSPLYPYLLAIYFLLFGHDLTFLRILQFLLGAVTAVLTCRLGARLFGRGAGLVAGLGAGIYGPFLFYEGQVMKEFLTPLFSVATLLLLYRGLDGGRRARASFALAGLCIGLAALVRDNFLLLLPLFAVLLIVEARRGSGEAAPVSGSPAASSGFRPRAADALAILLGALVPLLPVAWRNHHVAGEWVLTTSGGGEVFYIGNGPYANGAYVPPPFIRSNPRYEHEDFRRRAREITGRNLNRSESSSFWFHEGWRTITDDPLRFLRLLARKAFLFLDDHELPDNYSFYSFRRFSWTLTLLPTFAWAIALAAPGILVSATRWRDLLPLYLAGGGYMASVMLFFNFARFRLPFLPVLLVFAGEGAAALWEAVAAARAGGEGRSGGRSAGKRGAPQRGGWLRAAGLAAAAAAVFAIVHVDLSSGAEEPFQDRLHLGAAYKQAGRNAEAEQVLRETIRDAEALIAKHGWRPGMTAVPGGISFALALHSAHRDLAGVLLAENRTDDAIAELGAAIPFDPNDADLYQALGGALRTKGDLGAARRAYERGLAIKPESFTLRFDLATAIYESGDPASALRELLEARERNPGLADLDLADWHFGMGTVLTAIPGREGEGREHFREGLRLNPAHPQAAEARTLLNESRAAPP